MALVVTVTHYDGDAPTQADLDAIDQNTAELYEGVTQQASVALSGAFAQQLAEESMVAFSQEEKDQLLRAEFGVTA